MKIISLKINILLTIAILFCFSGGKLIAQGILSGVVTNTSHQPIPYANVYLSKTTFGVTTDDKGVYSLTIPVSGTYEMIASCVGYESFSQIIYTDDSPKRLDIVLPERVVMIREVTVKEKEINRKYNYALFKKCFFGTSSLAPYCTIENSKDLIVYRDTQDSNLVAYSLRPLVITNSALGYKIVYDLKYFRFNFENYQLKSKGDYYFKDISTQKRANSKVNRCRRNAYYGSRMHFLRALYKDSLQEEHFEICPLVNDSCGNMELSYSMKSKELKQATTPDSITLYHGAPVIIYYIRYMPELYSLSAPFRYIHHVSRIDFYNNLQVYKDGYYRNGFNVLWSGDMGEERVDKLLPHDYTPPPIPNVEPKKKQ